VNRQNWRVWPNAVDTDSIIEIAKDYPLHQATTFDGTNLDVRRSQVRWLTDRDDIRNLLIPFISEAAGIMGIDVQDLAEIQYTEYYASEGGKYDWHVDTDWCDARGYLDRKLSITVQLSDPSEYEGGDFEFLEVEQIPPWGKNKGSVLVFPSYLSHRVSPVTSGVRRSLVAWFSGPKWR